MTRFLRVGSIVVVALVVAVLGAKHVLMDTAPVPPTSRFQVDMGQVRELARSLPQPQPSRINAVVIAEQQTPSFAVVAGTGLAQHKMVRVSYQVMYPDRSVIIDTAMDLKDQAQEPGVAFHADHYQAMQEAMRRASAILVTHEHADHIGGLASSPYLTEIRGRVLLTAEQLSPPPHNPAALPPEARAAVRPLAYDKYHAVAPGLVLVKAPGHTPGSQLVYVRLEDGREYLFVGDIAWHMDNVTKLTGRPRLVTRWFVHEDRDAVLEQLRTLHDLREKEGLELIVAHDRDQLEANLAAGRFGKAFE